MYGIPRRLALDYGAALRGVDLSISQPGPPYLTVPFILSNLPVAIRDAMAEGMPAEVVEQLVPIVWREKWKAMKPFLLE